MRRYADTRIIYEMNVDEFAEFVAKAREQDKKEQIRGQWNALLPFMSMKLLKYMPFEEYEEICTGKNIDLRSNDEILRDIEETHRRAKEGGT